MRRDARPVGAGDRPAGRPWTCTCAVINARPRRRAQPDRALARGARRGRRARDRAAAHLRAGDQWPRPPPPPASSPTRRSSRNHPHPRLPIPSRSATTRAHRPDVDALTAHPTTPPRHPPAARVLSPGRPPEPRHSRPASAAPHSTNNTASNAGCTSSPTAKPVRTPVSVADLTPGSSTSPECGRGERRAGQTQGPAAVPVAARGAYGRGFTEAGGGHGPFGLSNRSGGDLRQPGRAGHNQGPTRASAPKR